MPVKKRASRYHYSNCRNSFFPILYDFFLKKTVQICPCCPVIYMTGLWNSVCSTDTSRSVQMVCPPMALPPEILRQRGYLWLLYECTVLLGNDAICERVIVREGRLHSTIRSQENAKHTLYGAVDRRESCRALNRKEPDRLRHPTGG